MNERDDKLVDLHDKLAEVLYERIQSPDCSPQDLNACRQFLKDNNVQSILASYAEPEQDNPVFKMAQKIEQEMRDFDEAAAG